MKIHSLGIAVNSITSSAALYGRVLDAAIDRVRSGGGRLVRGPVPARAFNGRLIACSWSFWPNERRRVFAR